MIEEIKDEITEIGRHGKFKRKKIKKSGETEVCRLLAFLALCDTFIRISDRFSPAAANSGKARPA